MDYFVNTGSWGSLFAVPNSVVDEYIKLASGPALKVLLYVLRNSNANVAKDEIAAALNINDEAIDDAFNFWENVGILSVSNQNNNNNSIKKTAVNNSAKNISGNSQTNQNQNNTPIRRPATDNSSERFNLRPAEIAERIKSSEQIRNLFMMAESSLGRMLNNTDQRSLIWIHEYLGLSADVILTLISYCTSLGKKSMVYIEKVAFEWCERNVNTLNDAQNEIQRRQQFGSYEQKILIFLGINTRPSANQIDMIQEWYDKDLNIELIECAYNRTMDSIGKLSFPYMNTILMSWYDNKLLTEADVKEFEKKNPPSKKNYRNGSRNSVKERKNQTYDIDEFEKFAINYEELKKVGE